VAYDIANPRRLVKVHNVLKKEGLAVQKSLFFVYGTETGMNKLLDRIGSIMALKEDDLRAYPVSHPRKIWTNGPNPLADYPVLHFESAAENTGGRKKKEKTKNWLKRMLGL